MENPEQVKADNPAIIRSFSISGLYGYRDVGMTMETAASVFIAQNGTGKTTLLAALNAVLNRQFGKLRSLEFNEMVLGLHGQEDIVIRKSDIAQVFDAPLNDKINDIALRIDESASKVFRYITEKFSPEQTMREYYGTRSLFDDIVGKHEYDQRKALEYAINLQKLIYAASPPLLHAYDSITRVIAQYEIVYLPTYRRIELVLDEDKSLPAYRRVKPTFEYAADTLYSGSMQFGLSDISEQLSRLNSDLTSQSDTGYRKISVNIINDLIQANIDDRSLDDFVIPSKGELRVFFSRIGKPSIFGPAVPIEVPNFDEIYNRPPDETDQGKFLKYFLSKLNDVIENTKLIEAPIRQFVKTCNKYLGSSEDLDEEFWSSRYYSAPVDPKRIKLDRSNLSISVESVERQITIPLDSLSSGEKQMVSLFAKMYLSSSNKIVLIDEPELSLSIGWQTLILPDIFSAPSCQQLVAITHSPFVFENHLEPYAKVVSLEAASKDDLAN